MRRSDKELSSRPELDAILHAAQVCRLASAAFGEPYLVPVSFGYDGVRLYFHTALDGRKVDCMRADPRLCFEVESELRLVRHPDRACSWSFAYASVVGFGRARELLDPDERHRGLREIMRHYSGSDQWDFSPNSLDHTRVWELTIDSMTGKRSLEKDS